MLTTTTKVGQGPPDESFTALALDDKEVLEICETHQVAKQIDVVGAVIVRDGLILCAQRGKGPLTGMWEFPGGKVEVGETPRQALEREIAEELHCQVKVGEEVTTTTHEYDFAAITLTTFLCDLLDGVPELTEHAQVRWLPRAELATLEWAPADVPAVQLMVGGSLGDPGA